MQASRKQLLDSFAAQSAHAWAYLEPDGKVTACSAAFAAAFGLAAAEIVGREIHDAVGPTLHPPISGAVAQALAGRKTDVEAQVRGADAKVARWLFSLVPQPDHAGGKVIGLHLAAARQSAPAKLAAAVLEVRSQLLFPLGGGAAKAVPAGTGAVVPAAREERLLELMALACDWFWEQDAEGFLTRLESSSDSANSGLTGAYRHSFVGRNWQEIDSDSQTRTDWDWYHACLARRKPFKHVLIKQHLPDHTDRWVEVSGAPKFDDDNNFTGYQGIAQDVTSRVQAEQQVAQMAFRDPLTRLPNRTLALDRLRQAISLSRRSKKSIAVFFIDLDNFKAVNDGLGHHAGDEVLKAFVARARTALRETDTLGRMGGDEFLAILPDLPESRPSIRVAEAILATARESTLINGTPVGIGASIGVALFPEDGGTAEKLIQSADIAMYEAKRSGRNRICFFHDTMQKMASTRLSITSDLRQALSKSEFFVCYQPIVHLADGSIFGAETLVRWRRSAAVTVDPADFIPSAEELGIIDGIGLWIIEQACMQLRAWQGQGLHLQRLSINVSPRQLRQKNFAEEVAHIVKQAGVDPRILELEITEGVLMESSEATVQNLHRIRRAGVRLCIDDFGTGFSNLSYVTRHSFDTLKIDRYFVSRIPADRASFAIIRSVCALAKELGIEVIAEGVEHAEQRDALAALECRVGQGFLWNAPLGAEEFILQYPGNSAAQA